MDGFLSLGSLLSYGGSVTAVCALTQIIKPLLSELYYFASVYGLNIVQVLQFICIS